MTRLITASASIVLCAALLIVLLTGTTTGDVVFEKQDCRVEAVELAAQPTAELVVAVVGSGCSDVEPPGGGEECFLVCVVPECGTTFEQYAQCAGPNCPQENVLQSWCAHVAACGEWDALCAIGDPGDGCCEDPGDGDPGVCGGGNGGPVVSANSVDLWRGNKVERAVDLRIPVIGNDIVISRGYSSKPDFESDGLVGKKWTLSLFETIEAGPDQGQNEFAITLKSGGYGVRAATSGTSTPTEIPLGGPNTSKWVRTSVQHESKSLPVWRLVTPGQGHKDFFRKNESGETGASWHTVDGLHSDSTDFPEGLPFRIEDLYGNNQRFEYTAIQKSFRLSTIHVNEIGASEAEAKLDFTWYLDLPGSARYGRLHRIDVERRVGQDWVLTNQAIYTYMDEAATDVFSLDLGRSGDLVQVLVRERVDARPGEQFEPDPEVVPDQWREWYTQYRYHRSDASSNQDVSDGARDYAWAGDDHQLKMVILPEQIEYAYAERAGERGAGQTNIFAEAVTLLRRADGDVAFGSGQDEVLVIDLAAKVIEEYGSTGDKQVLTQHLRAGCGCASASTQGLTLSYAYFDHNQGRTARITESYGQTTHRKLYHDIELLNGIPYLRTEAIVDGASASMQWVTHYIYNSDRQVKFQITPSALDQYSPSDANNQAPSYSASTDSGLVYGYAYNSKKYRTETRVREGYSATLGDYAIISKQEYDANRPHVVTQVKRYTRDDGVEGTNGEFVELTSYTYGYHTNGGDDVAWIGTSVEAELSAENGPGGTYTSYELFDERGRNFWSRTADHALTYRTFDSTESVLTIRRNAPKNGSPALPSSHGTENALDTTGWSDRSADGSLLTEFVRDPLGRVRERVSPALVSSFIAREMRPYSHRNNALLYAEVSLPHELDAVAGSYDGPAVITWYNAAGKVIGVEEHLIGAAGYTVAGNEGAYQRIFSDYDLGDEVGRTVLTLDLTGLVKQERVWHDVAADGSYLTEHEYDDIGRLARTIQPNGTIHENQYDVLGRVTARRVGTNSGNMKTVAEFFFDGPAGQAQHGMGNGTITLVREHVDDQATRDTIYTYDFRDRRTWSINPLPPHEFVEYDNLGRVVAQAQYTQAPADLSDPVPPQVSLRGAYAEVSFSQRGLAYSQRVAVDPGVASPDFLESHTWFDPVGRAVARLQPNSPMTKTQFDALGRTVTSYSLAGQHQSFASVYNAQTWSLVLNEPVIEQTDYRFIATTGQLDLVTSRQRMHDVADTVTGALTNQTSITTFSGNEYDAAGRVTRRINFGTRHSNGFAAGGSAPTTSTNNGLQVFNTVAEDLITVMAYDHRGRAASSTDPEQQVNTFVYDDLDRQIAVIENHDGTPDMISWNGTRWAVAFPQNNPDDVNRVTSFVYDSVGNVIQQIAHEPDGQTEDVQITQYIYGVTTSDTHPSEVNSFDLLQRIIYPAGQSSPNEADRTVTYAYNRLGETTLAKDQNGTVHQYLRDARGRVIADHASTLGQDIDNAIVAVGTDFDDLGRPSTVRSYSVYNPQGSSTVANAVEFTYTPLGQVEEVIQAPFGDVDQNSLRVAYAYAGATLGNGNFSRQSGLTYPGGESIDYLYGTSTSVNHRISRVRAIDTGGVQGHVDYHYIGLSMTAVVDYTGPDVQLDRTAQSDGNRNFGGGANQTGTAGRYPGYDRFGRTQSHMWVDGAFQPFVVGQMKHNNQNLPHVPPIVEITHTYDKASNRLTRYNQTATLAWSHRHEEFEYDGLHRLAEARRGVRDGQSFTHSSTHKSQQWALDMLGNWDEFKTWNVGSSSYGDVETRTHNDVNELTSRTLPGNATPLDSTYDKVGNLRTQEIRQGTNTITITYTWDAWNRLVKVEYGSSVRARYQYNGLNWRTVKRSDTSSPPNGTLNQQRVMYYNAAWQLMEELINDSWATSSSNDDHNRRMQYIWGLRYIDDIAVRRELEPIGTLGPGTLVGGPWYHLTDTLFSTVAILDDSAQLVERVSYDAYGRARHHRMADLTGDGSVDQSDRNAMRGINWNNYGVGDLNRDGIVDSADLALLNADWGRGLGEGRISSGGTDNIVGYAGYIFNAEMHGAGLYTVRHRHYSPELGRWISRDPAGYVDGMSEYEYSIGSPAIYVDPFGLQVAPPRPAVRPRPPLPPRRQPDGPQRGPRPIQTPQGPKYPIHEKPWEWGILYWEWHVPPKPPPGYYEVPQWTTPNNPNWRPLYRPIQPVAPAPQPAPQPVIIPAPGSPEYERLPRKVKEPGEDSEICRRLHADLDKYCKQGGVPTTCSGIKLPDITNDAWCKDIERRRDRAKLCCFIRANRWAHRCHPHDQTHADEVYRQCNAYLVCKSMHEDCLKRCGGIGPVLPPPGS